MARTIEEIKAQMLEQKALKTELAELNSVSNTAIWSLWMYIQAVIIYYFEVLQDTFKGEVQAIIDGNQYGTKQWWFNSAKAYQHEDLLVFADNVFKYPAIDTTKQIIKYCSITDVGGKVQVKVAKQASSQPVVLSSDELNGMVDYVNEIKPAGTNITVQSLAADLVKIRLNVYYNANAGFENVKGQVEAAIVDFMANIQFDGTLYINKLIDAIQAVPAVINEQVEVLESAVKGSGDPYVDFTTKYAAKSGYFKIDPDYPLGAQITYIT